MYIYVYVCTYIYEYICINIHLQLADLLASRLSHTQSQRDFPTRKSKMTSARNRVAASINRTAGCRGGFRCCNPKIPILCPQESPYVPSVLPTVGPRDHSRPGY